MILLHAGNHYENVVFGICCNILAVQQKQMYFLISFKNVNIGTLLIYRGNLFHSYDAAPKKDSRPY